MGEQRLGGDAAGLQAAVHVAGEGVRDPFAGEQDRAGLGRAAVAVLLEREQGGVAGELAGREADVGALGQRVVGPAGAAVAAVRRRQAGQGAAGGGGEAAGELGGLDRGGGADLIAAEEVAEGAGPGRGRERDRIPAGREAAGRPERAGEAERSRQAGRS